MHLELDLLNLTKKYVLFLYGAVVLCLIWPSVSYFLRREEDVPWVRCTLHFVTVRRERHPWDIFETLHFSYSFYSVFRWESHAMQRKLLLPVYAKRVYLLRQCCLQGQHATDSACAAVRLGGCSERPALRHVTRFPVTHPDATVCMCRYGIGL
jgi:hypothetical protein